MASKEQHRGVLWLPQAPADTDRKRGRGDEYVAGETKERGGDRKGNLSLFLRYLTMSRKTSTKTIPKKQQVRPENKDQEQRTTAKLRE